MKKFTFNLIVSALLLSSSTMFSQELVVKSNLEGLTMSVGETFKPTSFAENLKGEKKSIKLSELLVELSNYNLNIKSLSHWSSPWKNLK